MSFGHLQHVPGRVRRMSSTNISVGGGGDGANKGSSSFFASIELETERIQKKKNAMPAQQKQKGMSGVFGVASESSSAGVLLAGR